MLEPGALVYFEHKEEHSWVLGKVKSWNGKAGSCESDDPKHPNVRSEKLSEECMFPISRDVIEEDVNDLLSLTILHDSTLLNCLKRRYFKDVIYTNIGAIVVALNPFNFKIPRYMDDEMPKYLAEGDRIEHNLPHSWAVAHNTYFEMLNDQQNQCILVSGESGAGKTEASKIVMKYLGAISCKQGEGETKAAAMKVGAKINICSPILESFGNAKTVRNDNSSRFGKFMKVQFSSQGFLVGAFVIKYLLEKSRIITAAKGERVYHSFYLMCRANAEFRGKYHTGEDKTYTSLSSGGTFENKEFNKEEDFDEVIAAMGEVGMTEDEKLGVWATVAGVLHIENTRFDEDGEGCKLDKKTEPMVDMSCACWGVDSATMIKEFQTTTLVIAGTTCVKQLRPVQAYDARDALVKTLYDQCFGWLVEKINSTLDVGEACSSWIGLLDIFGFEDFETGNYFEQLCINLANETIQGHYNKFIFEKDMDECRAEGIDVASVKFPDNTPCLHMIAGKGGILALLDEECSLGKGSDHGFLDNVTRTFKSNKEFFDKKTLAKHCFIIHHYAGSVSYDVRGALDKNRDTLKDSCKLMMRASSNDFIKTLIPAPVEKSGRRVTVGVFFKQQLKDLMDLINSTNPHWIRCVKPHPAKKPLMLHGVSTMSQLGSSGVLGTVKIRKAGYPVRLPFDLFWPRYRVIALEAGKGVGLTLAQAKEGCATLLQDALGWGHDMFQMGVTRVFLKAHAYIEVEKEKKRSLAKSAIKVQAAARWKLSLPEVRHRRRVAAARNIQEEFRDFMVRCADLRAERERIRKELAAKHGAEISALTEEGLAGLEPIYQEFEVPYANWKLQMEREAKEIEQIIAQFGESRQQIRLDHAKGAAEIEAQSEKEYAMLQQQLLAMLLDCISLSENDARNAVRAEEVAARELLALTLEDGFAFVEVLGYIEKETEFRRDIEEMEMTARLELETRWNIMSEQERAWDAMMAVMVPKCDDMRKGIKKYQQRLQRREEIVRERQMLDSGSSGGGAPGARQYVQCMPDGRPVVVSIDSKVNTKGKAPWVSPIGLPSSDQITRATQRSKEELNKLRQKEDPVLPASPPRAIRPAPHHTTAAAQRRQPQGLSSPRRGPISSTIPEPSWGSPSRASLVDPASSMSHTVVGASASALEKMGETNPMFKSIFFASRSECAAQLQWLHAQGAYPPGKLVNPTDIGSLKALKQAESLLTKYKQAYCDKMRRELKRLNTICKQCNVPDKHPVTQQQTKMTPVHQALVRDYPPTTDVFKCVEEVTRLSKAIFEHKDQVLSTLESARDEGLLSVPLSQEMPYHELKTILDENPQVRRFQNMVRCTSCHSFFRETVGRCWCCGGSAKLEFG
eukprot:TRINITY_DN3322_c1_g1_i1.p1 TRINITY_DN3322_c1_g1~~TRINITY_DN3322_c1_g1_i1.p1  ORF type:complete len:1360 (+),score=526.71 TRINITY_DN3322_c1_g1_i1:117-4196(+)